MAIPPLLKRERTTADWLRVVGWQINALIFVLLVGTSFCGLCCSYARRNNARAERARELRKITHFVAECVPTESKDKLQEFLADAADVLILHGQRELKRMRGRGRRGPRFDPDYDRFDIPRKTMTKYKMPARPTTAAYKRPYRRYDEKTPAETEEKAPYKRPYRRYPSTRVKPASKTRW